jgi:adenylate kinase
MKKKKVILLTNNIKKYEEYVKIFKKYDIEVEMKKSIFEKDFKDCSYVEQKEYLKLLKDTLFNDQDFDVISIMWDISDLYNRKTDEISEKNTDMEMVYNKTVLYFYTKENKYEKWTETINGWIDLSKKEVETFSWDDIFVVSTTGLSYHELNNRNIKISPRNKLISKFIKENIYYKEKLDLNFNKQNQERSIEFDNKVIDFIHTNKYLILDNVKEEFEFIFNSAMNNGAFFRSAKNRREKNYWLPGLNSGIPLVAKKDEIHEITFAVHDLCHFMMPDLVFEGKESYSKQDYKNVYVIYRMMSEALTMVFADMLFIHKLVENNIDYDFNKRKIYPLFKSILNENPNLEIKDILYANVQYCLKGDDSYYIKLLNNKNLEVLEDFKLKFSPFFIEDFKWTDQNFENMYQNIEIFKLWYTDNENIIQKSNLHSVFEFDSLINIQEEYNMKVDTIIEQTFNYVLNQFYYNNKLKDNMNNMSNELLITNSFKKYMLGQLVIFYKFDFLAISKPYRNKIRSVLNNDIITQNEINNIRELYENYLIILKDDLHLIDEDDYMTYKEVFPVFESFYVFYDKEKDYYPTLTEISNKILIQS